MNLKNVSEVIKSLWINCGLGCKENVDNFRHNTSFVDNVDNMKYIQNFPTELSIGRSIDFKGVKALFNKSTATTITMTKNN